MSQKDIDYMEQMNREMKQAIEANDFDFIMRKT